MEKNTKVMWDYKGKPDFINGTGAYLEEKIIGYAGSIVIPLLLAYFIFTSKVEWNYFQMITAFLIAFDIGGGMISNSLNSAKRFYHSSVKKDEGTTGIFLKNKWLFSLVHIHPFIIGIMFDSGNWLYGLKWYILFLLAVLIVNVAPLYLKRPISMLLILFANLLNFYFILPIPGFDWFIPFLFLKIITGHLVKEEPYRKANSIH
ncbi:hypothetical protein [Metabacillus fastidiosus]|uniref:hypothetical protein n=1 Tax=Metabacillus fastidiosus TaxID=1458 RepID=UPI000826B6A1|nr:hypothetical protein [Metabacillus fastidiosus]MED4462350.1 hypothetical protein [Metabacillus fastidiosus]